MVLLRVKDEGNGIPEAARSTLFQRFQHGASERRGLGLGLYLTKQLAEAHGGSLAVQFPPEGGSIFEVCLPGAAAD
jgi:signal transduction histidine kinase